MLVARLMQCERQGLIGQLNLNNQLNFEEVGDTERTLAWQIDNAHKGMDGKFDEISLDVTDRITYLVDEVINKRIGEQNYERIETEKMHDAKL